MNNRTSKIANKFLLKSSGNFVKVAQQSAADARAQAKIRSANREKALAFMKEGRFDRIPVAGAGGVYFASLEPAEKLQIVNYWKNRIANGPNREAAAKDFIGLMDIGDQQGLGIADLSSKDGFPSRIKYLDELASDIATDMQAAAGQGAGAAASTGPASGGSPKAQGPQQDMRSPYDPNVPLGAGPEGQKPSPTTPSKDDVASKAPAGGAAAADTTGGGGAAGGGAAGGAAAGGATPATPANTNLPPSGSSASNVRQPNYFFPEGKQAAIEGYYGPYAGPNGKKRYFKVVYDRSSKRYSYTGEFEDR